ncbi:MAG: hypothetical protein OER88_03710 [Planctomycetota bacterium]|nr:hypothetical protein [Planctomycetota bacterium]
MLTVADHPSLVVAVFTTDFGRPLRDREAREAWLNFEHEIVPPGIERTEERRKGIRDMLRHGGYKPTGRGKPASEYLIKAVEAGKLGPINAAVDVCNVVSYFSGFPISVVDLASAKVPFEIAVAPEGASYAFNPSGQTIDLGGLLCLFDRYGPCGNAVKDSQRTKTNDETHKTLSVLWGCKGHERALDIALAWYFGLLSDAGGQTNVLVR